MENQLQCTWFGARETNIGPSSIASLTKSPVTKLRLSGTNSAELWSQLLLSPPNRGYWRLKLCTLQESIDPFITAQEICHTFCFDSESQFSPLCHHPSSKRINIKYYGKEGCVFRTGTSCIYRDAIQFTSSISAFPKSLCFHHFQAAQCCWPAARSTATGYINHFSSLIKLFLLFFPLYQGNGLQFSQFAGSFIWLTLEHLKQAKDFTSLLNSETQTGLEIRFRHWTLGKDVIG